MKKYGFLFGAGAEIAYNLPSGGQFALDIFRQDPAEPKQMFRKMRDNVRAVSSLAIQGEAEWLPLAVISRELGVARISFVRYNGRDEARLRA